MHTAENDDHNNADDNHELHDDDDVAEVGIDADLDFSRLAATTDSVALPGVQGKVSAGRSRRPGTTQRWTVIRPSARERSANQYILKYDTSSFPLLSRNERAHLEAARALGIPVETADLIEDIHGVDGLLVDRFDRKIAPNSARITRLAMEDASQLLGLPPAAKYDPTTEEVAFALADACDAKPVARRNVFL